MRIFLFGLLALCLCALCWTTFSFNLTQVPKYEVYRASEQLSVDSRLRLSERKPLVLRDVTTNKERRLYGRFLHITDIHPDPYYLEDTSIENVCHSGDPDGRHDRAPAFGKAMCGCDTSPLLMDETFKWIAENLRDKIDFVVWTGDNIRHDNDRHRPRTESQIFEWNSIVAKKLEDIFKNKNSLNPREFDVPLIPSLGNNDVFPHNLFSLGPTLQTREYYRLWGNLIPEEQQRTFDRAASFLKEVIPGKLAVLSINTLYLFKANPLVDDCLSKKQPGYQLLLWLGYVLEELRKRKMKVWLTGHVPPIPKNCDSSCYTKFTLWTHEYSDVIIGGIYGHMNLDHFVPVDGSKAWDDFESMSMKGLDATHSRIMKEMRVSYAEGLDLYLQMFPEEAMEAINHGEQYDALQHPFSDDAFKLMGTKPSNKNKYMDNLREDYNVIKSQLDSVSKDGRKKKKKRRRGRKKQKDKFKKDSDVFDRYSIVNVGGSVIPTFNPVISVWEYNVTDLVDSDFDSKILTYEPWDAFFQQLDLQIQEDIEGDDIQINARSKKDKSIPKKGSRNKFPAGPGQELQLFSPTYFVKYYADLEEINKCYDMITSSPEFTSKEDAISKAFKFKVEYTSTDEPYPMENLLNREYVKLAAKLAKDDKKWEVYKERAFASTGYDGT